ncbi:AAA family ATPase [Streptomyces cocklensis]|uniref:ATP-binding protein n=1 Tax=Actinacidiphila cocklensis TaxID=887465 RepID=UPI00204181B7|nr:AAA family ATPase [Actinacidiphila cocklensis]MDD1059603.1 AAA family ATPase [Actinacidiphila cocklensis]
MSLRHLLARAALVEERVRRAVDARQAVDPQPDDAFRGLYLSDETVRRLLDEGRSLAGPDQTDAERFAAAEALADASEGPPGGGFPGGGAVGGAPFADGPPGNSPSTDGFFTGSPGSALGASPGHGFGAGPFGGPLDGGSPVRATAPAGGASRLRHLARAFDLTPLDVEILLIALVPDLDDRFEQFYGYLNDHVARCRPTVGLALGLSGRAAADPHARARLAPQAPLRAGGLLVVEETERPFLSRSLRVPDRVAGHLLGDDTPAPRLADLLTPWHDVPGVGDPDVLARALAHGVRLAHLREEQGGAGTALAAAALLRSGHRVLGVDLLRLAQDPHPGESVRVLAREARLTGAGLVCAPLEALTPERTEALRLLADTAPLTVLVGRTPWDAAWSTRPPLLLHAPRVDPVTRAALWARTYEAPVPDDLDVRRTLAPFLLTPDQITRAARSTAQAALLSDGPLDADHVRAGARAQNAAGLDRLARRVEPAVGWDDLVLPADPLSQLHELAARARHRDLVLGAWGMRPGGGRGRGVTALFAGDSGTGKTMSAEVIAKDLGLDLYTVDLATVIDKYIGETEKNLERIFSEAAGVNGVLLFDEADAIFGKRSEVKDAHDRYANVESAYLLQRMETFDGLAVLATNLRANLDDAFTRRLDLVVDFPLPDAEQRHFLWHRALRPVLPPDSPLDLDFCAQSFELAGGNIRSIAVTAAYLAAEAGTELTMPMLIHAVQREYQKLGRLTLPSEFGEYAHLLTT